MNPALCFGPAAPSIDADARCETEDLQRQRCHLFSVFCLSIGTNFIEGSDFYKSLEHLKSISGRGLACLRVFFFVFCHLFLQVAEGRSWLLVHRSSLQGEFVVQFVRSQTRGKLVLFLKLLELICNLYIYIYLEYVYFLDCRFKSMFAYLSSMVPAAPC